MSPLGVLGEQRAIQRGGQELFGEAGLHLRIVHLAGQLVTVHVGTEHQKDGRLGDVGLVAGALRQRLAHRALADLDHGSYNFV